MEMTSLFINACITALSLGMFVLCLVSYRRSQNKKILLITAAFFVFFIKGAVLSYGLFISLFEQGIACIYLGIFDIVILVLLFLSTLKR